jgi:hypothetical protein
MLKHFRKNHRRVSRMASSAARGTLLGPERSRTNMADWRHEKREPKDCGPDGCPSRLNPNRHQLDRPRSAATRPPRESAWRQRPVAGDVVFLDAGDNKRYRSWRDLCTGQRTPPRSWRHSGPSSPGASAWRTKTSWSWTRPRDGGRNRVSARPFLKANRRAEEIAL